MGSLLPICAGLGIALAATNAPAGSPDDSYISSLTREGSVLIENGRVHAKGLDAQTRFDLAANLDWSYNTTYRQTENQLELEVTPRISRIELAVKHFLTLPKQSGHDARLYQALLLHEYDHVAISCDGRPRALLQHLLRSMGSFRVPWPGHLPPAPSSVNALIRKEADLRKDVVVALMNDAYQRIDEATDHGRRPLPNRSAFFGWLYSEDHLREVKFPYLVAVEAFLRSPAYLNAKKYYRL